MIDNTDSDDSQKLESQLTAWGVPPELAKELREYHSRVTFAPGEVIYTQGSPADILYWVIKGVAKITCPQRNGTRILARLVTAGEFLGLADERDEKNHWVRRFDAEAVSKCVLAMITRHHVRELLKVLDNESLLQLMERANSAWAGWVQYYAMFLGYSFRERLELALTELGRKFGVSDSDGILLTFEPGHADLAEMIGSSRPLVSRLMAQLQDEGEIARRGRRYVLLNAGVIASAASKDFRPSRDEPAQRARTIVLNKTSVAA